MNFTQPHFAEPQWLWLAVFGPLALFALHRYSGWARRRQLARIAPPAVLSHLTASHSPLRRAFKETLLLLALGLIGVTLARPQWGQQPEAGQALGKDTVFLLDCSRSMLATDVLPNRLERAKLAILDYVQRSGRGRVGIVAFAGQSFLQCPLTYDYTAFREALITIDDRTIPIPGTDIGRALQEAFRASERNERQKLLVLVTDGEDLEKSGISVAEKLARDGVVVYSVGVGTPAGSEIQLINEQGRLDLLRDSRGEVVRSRLDEPTLTSIARVTKGAYFPLGPLGEGLTRVRLASEELGAGAGAAPARKLGIDRFHLPLAIVIVLLVLESLLGTRRRRIPAITAGQSVPTSAILGILALCQIPVEAAPAPPMKPREIYNAGTQQLEKGKLREAENLLESATAAQDESIQPPALYNLGHVRFLQGEEMLKKAPAAKPTLRQGTTAVANSQAAVKTAEDALQLKELRGLVNAYLNGRGARRELNAAIKAVRQASEVYGTALSRWQRASGDFKSAVELNPKDADAKANADIVDQKIARLIDSLRELQTMSGMLSSMKKELGQKMEQLKGQIPDQDMPPGAQGDEDEEEEITPKDLEGKEEAPSKEGKEMELTPEQAGWLLEAFRLDKERRLPMGEGTEDKPRDRNRPNW
jgi:Ca-activated chloride channel family protein